MIYLTDAQLKRDIRGYKPPVYQSHVLHYLFRSWKLGPFTERNFGPVTRGPGKNRSFESKSGFVKKNNMLKDQIEELSRESKSNPSRK